MLAFGSSLTLRAHTFSFSVLSVLKYKVRQESIYRSISVRPLISIHREDVHEKH